MFDQNHKKQGLIVFFASLLALFAAAFYGIRAIINIAQEPEQVIAYIQEQAPLLRDIFTWVEKYGIFIIMGFIALVMTAKFTKNTTLMLVLSKLYSIFFLLFWFGFLIIFTGIAIVSKVYIMAAFTSPFWAIGILVLYRQIIAPPQA